jgi:multicomponent K+:H+ antiporter subunit D
MTKVGVYAVARLYTLVFGDAGGVTEQVAQPWLPALALATLALAAIGALAARTLRGLIGYLVIASAGTLLLAFGTGVAHSAAAGVFYIVNSTLVVAALYLLAERVEQQRAYGDEIVPGRFGPERLVLGAFFFVFAIAVAGLPPLAGFLGKSLLLEALRPGRYFTWSWVIVLASSLAIVIALARAGSRVFWKPALPGAAAFDTPVATTPLQAVAIGWLLALLGVNTIGAGALADYADAAAAQLHARRPYVEAVLGARPVPAALPIRTLLGGKPKEK